MCMQIGSAADILCIQSHAWIGTTSIVKPCLMFAGAGGSDPGLPARSSTMPRRSTLSASLCVGADQKDGVQEAAGGPSPPAQSPREYCTDCWRGMIIALSCRSLQTAGLMPMQYQRCVNIHTLKSLCAHCLCRRRRRGAAASAQLEHAGARRLGAAATGQPRGAAAAEDALPPVQPPLPAGEEQRPAHCDLGNAAVSLQAPLGASECTLALTKNMKAQTLRNSGANHLISCRRGRRRRH